MSDPRPTHLTRALPGLTPQRAPPVGRDSNPVASALACPSHMPGSMGSTSDDALSGANFGVPRPMRKIPYRTSGGRVYLLCVFHREKSPSLVVFPSGRFLCHGCGTGGVVVAYPELFNHPELAEHFPTLGEVDPRQLRLPGFLHGVESQIRTDAGLSPTGVAIRPLQPLGYLDISFVLTTRLERALYRI